MNNKELRVLIVDHVAHRKTQSSNFFIELLRSRFQVEVFYYDQTYHVDAGKQIERADVVVWFEFLPARFRIFAPQKKNVFVPMYDNEWGSWWQWKRIAWSGMGVVSFCEKVTRHARRCGVTNIIDVKFFLDPNNFKDMEGDPRKVLFWDRGSISESVARRLFEGLDVEFIRKTSFLPRTEYLEFIRNVGTIVAPRLTEGIGMPVVEAMAMGKCVVANDDATMNEYVADGETGLLFSASCPKPLSFDSILRVRSKVKMAARSFYERWKTDRNMILDFIQAQTKCDPTLLGRCKLVCSYLLFVGEGILYRLTRSSLPMRTRQNASCPESNCRI